MSAKFGTSGLRGLSVDLIGMPSALYTTAFCTYLKELGAVKEGDKVLVGRDFRASSPEIAASCMGAIAGCGFAAVDCGTLPTPALASYGLAHNAASLMITGSHIPADRNGIKFYLPTGEISKKDEQAISALAVKLDGTVIQTKAEGTDEAGAANACFLSRCKAILPENALAGLKIGVYQHSTVARDLFVELMHHYGAEVTPLGRSETFIPVDTEAVSPETLSLLDQWTNQDSFDAIISADGDGDRPLVADETGQPLRGDLLGLMAAKFLNAQVIATPVTSNSGLEKNGAFEVIRTQVGSPFVIDAMLEAKKAGKKNIIGFEANGGFLTGTAFAPTEAMLESLMTRDCVLPILAALNLVATSGKSLSQLQTDFSLPIAVADRIKDFAQERSMALMAHIASSSANLASFLDPIGVPKAINDTDGLRVTLENESVIHFRPSGNAPEMRCYVEAETEDKANQILAMGLELIRDF